MRVLYHFPKSPFSRRTRLALAHKGLKAELRDARNNPALLEEARARSPLRTIPVLVEENGHAIGDSSAISHYLDRAYPDAPALWPSDPEGAASIFEIASLVDGALNTLVDIGTRMYPLRSHEAWESVKGEALRRAQGAIDALGERAASALKEGRETLVKSGYCAADIWLFAAVEWLTGLAERAPTFAPAAQIVSLGWTTPDALVRWAEAHRGRDDVRALDA